MVRYRLFPFRHILPLIPFIFLGLIYRDAIIHVLFFNANASDLQGIDGIAMKQQLFDGMISLSNALFEYSFLQSFLFPIIIALAAFIYHFLTTRHLKHIIGKRSNYSQKRLSLKWQLAVMVVGLYQLILVVLVSVGIWSGRHTITNLDMYFQEGSLLSFFSISTSHYLLFHLLVKSCALLVQSLFTCFLVDYYGSFSKAALSYILMMWGLAPILYSFLPIYLVPMSNLMITSYGGITLWQIGVTYLPFALTYIVLKWSKSYEVV